jgi:hypothetical protein
MQQSMRKDEEEPIGGEIRRDYYRLHVENLVHLQEEGTLAPDYAPEVLLVAFIHMEDMGVQIPAYGDRTVATPYLRAAGGSQ